MCVEINDLEMGELSILLKDLKYASLETDYFPKIFYLKKDKSYT